ncbi:uncharacterized protein LOC130356803 [Hyla sarda]|uniref:uncharacterized protein LOC130356803 n=1 Tax=Hyla sarda TaxID=327740 RepID=UPI0024C41F91|nr:uncharacterized protein LOC130356803 [Hyla sarda]
MTLLLAHQFLILADTCSRLEQLKNGRTFFRYGGIYANFACNPGFSLLGHVSNICIQGRWRKPLPVCIASGCHMPMGIVRGSLKTSHNNAVISVTCEKGYKLFGSSLIFCDGKKWNSTIPICREKDMMGSNLQKKISGTEKTFVVGNPLSKREQIRALYNNTQKGYSYSEIVSINTGIAAPRKGKDFKNMSSYHGQEVLGHQRQLQSPKTFLSFIDLQNLSPKRLKAATMENIKLHVTSGYSWSSTATHIQNSPKRNQTSQIKAIRNLTQWYYSPTPGSSGFTDTQIKHPYFAKYEKNVTSSYVDSPLHLRTTTSNIQQTTQQVQSAYLSTLLENKTPANSNANSYLPNVLAVVNETVKKSIQSSTKPYNTTNNTTTLAQMVINITSSLIHSNPTPHVPVQATETTIVESITANVGVNTTAQDNFITSHNVASTYPEHKETFLSKPANAKVYSPSALPGPTATVTAITSNSKRDHKNFGMLKRGYKRRVQCVYPPLPSHGTFRFFTVKDPLPNQYPYYIQYSCYPGYTMSTGDVNSFCKDNGEWSGLTPVCEAY